VFSLTSKTFKDGHHAAQEGRTQRPAATNPNPNLRRRDTFRRNCRGPGVPDGTKSLVLLMEDLGRPRRRRRAPHGHLRNRRQVTGFAEGELSKPSDKFVGGKATQGTGIYNGPCTPPNVQPHHYTFVLIATDYDTKDVPRLTRKRCAKLAPVQGQPNHVKGSAGIVGLFVKADWTGSAAGWAPRLETSIRGGWCSRPTPLRFSGSRSAADAQSAGFQVPHAACQREC